MHCRRRCFTSEKVPNGVHRTMYLGGFNATRISSWLLKNRSAKCSCMVQAATVIAMMMCLT